MKERAKKFLSLYVDCRNHQGDWTKERELQNLKHSALPMKVANGAPEIGIDWISENTNIFDKGWKT